MTTSLHAGVPGLLRLTVIFHEGEAMGAGLSVAQALEPLRAWGWTACGWFASRGRLPARAAPLLARSAVRDRPVAVSVRGWRAPPGVLARTRATPAYLTELGRRLREWRPHVVHANTLRALPEALVARRLGLPVVLQLHEVPSARKDHLALRAAGRLAAVIVAVSEDQAAIARPHVGGAPLLVVPNGVAPAPRRRDERRPFTIGAVGGVSPVKGTDVFLRAAARVLAERPDARIVHAGPAGVSGDVAFDRLVRHLHVDASTRGEVRMLGWADAAEVLPGLDVFVSPSREESHGMAVAEALSAGLPVVATDVGGQARQIRHLENGILVPPDDPGALADWVLRLAADADLAARLGAGARADRSRPTPTTQAAGLHRAYLTALGRTFAPPALRP
jgi:glycosyltransferase involved in cell wall biosynthesis